MLYGRCNNFFAVQNAKARRLSYFNIYDFKILVQPTSIAMPISRHDHP